jgi:hypothetical protein
MLNTSKPWVGSVVNDWHWLSRGTWLRWRRLLIAVVAMDKGMSRGTSLDLAQSNEITPLEVTITVLKLPKCCLGAASMKNVTDYSICQLASYS